MREDGFNINARKHLSKAGGYLTYVPPKLPPNILWSDSLVRKIGQAERALGQLAGLGRTLPNPHLLIRPFLQREAVLSSQIEGTQASLSDVLLFDAGRGIEQEPPDVMEVRNYIRALEHGLERIKTLPMSRRLWCELHERLMQNVRGENRMPGEFRRSQVWIGPQGTSAQESRFVPPPPGPELERCLNELEMFIQSPSDLSSVVRLAMVHYQFETIHPFLDGNGRIGRLLITLMLCQDNILPQPLLYLSAFFERNRQRYYELLLTVSQQEAWEAWLSFFCQGVAEEATDAVNRARGLLDLQAKYVKQQKSLVTINLVDLLFERVAVNTRYVVKALKLTPSVAQRHINLLVDQAVLREITGNKRNRVYVATEILELLNKPTMTAPSTDASN